MKLPLTSLAKGHVLVLTWACSPGRQQCPSAVSAGSGQGQWLWTLRLRDRIHFSIYWKPQELSPGEAENISFTQGGFCKPCHGVMDALAHRRQFNRNNSYYDSRTHSLRANSCPRCGRQRLVVPGFSLEAEEPPRAAHRAGGRCSGRSPCSWAGALPPRAPASPSPLPPLSRDATLHTAPGSCGAGTPNSLNLI